VYLESKNILKLKLNKTHIITGKANNNIGQINLSYVIIILHYINIAKEPVTVALISSLKVNEHALFFWVIIYLFIF